MEPLSTSRSKQTRKTAVLLLFWWLGTALAVAQGGLPITDPAPLNTNADTDSGDDRTPFVATDGAGNWVAVWNSKDDLGGTIGTDEDILVARSADNGATWTAPQALNTNADTDSGNDKTPFVATDGAGNWVAVWNSKDNLGGTIGTDEDILVARSADTGSTWTAPQALNTNADTDSGDDRTPFVATDGAGNWVAVWDSKDNLGGTIGTDEDILVARSADNGATWTAPQALNTNADTDSGNDKTPFVATDGTGNWVAVWNSKDDLGGTIGTDEDILVARSADTGSTWTAPQALNTNADTDSGDDRTPFVTTDGTGNWVAVWDSKDNLGGTIGTDEDILVARSADNGATWTAPQAFNTNADTDSGDDRTPFVATDGAGNWVAVWSSNDDLGGSIGGDEDILVATFVLAAGVTITESGGSTDVTEDGATDTYTLVLDSPPLADVTVTVTPDTQTDLGAGPGTAIVLTFTDSDWDTPQTVTVTAVDDAVAEGPHTSTITHSATSADASYDGIAIPDVTANISDNDTASVTITESGGSTNVDEAGPTSDTYTVVLDSQPTADVTITVDPDVQTDLGSGAGTAIALTFTDSDWDTPQTVTVTAVDDAVAEGPHTSTITHSAASADASYDGIAIPVVTANLSDNDTAGVTITESGGSTDVDEAGPTSDDYTVVLDSQPTGNVTITVDPDMQTDLGAGLGTAVALTFTDSDWDTPQTVTVTAVDDAVAEGPHTSAITHAASSGDANYDSIAIPNVVANITDNDTAGVGIVESDGSTDVSEDGPTSDTYTLALQTRPTADVTVTVTPDDETDLGAGPATAIQFTFTTNDWSVRRTVVVTAVDDLELEESHVSTIAHTVSSADPRYDGMAIADVVAGITDNDIPGVTITESDGSTDVAEARTTSDSYAIVLESPPAADVLITVDPDEQTDVGAGPGAVIVLTLTDGNWDQPQTMTVTAVDDAVDEGLHTSTITHTASSADRGYDGIAISSVVANVTDNDAAPSDDDANPEPEPEPELLADLRVTVEAPATTTDVLVGDEVVFTVTVENVGTAAATDIVLTIPMPENAEFVLARLVTGPPTQAADPVVTAGDRFVTLELGDVPAGDSLQVEIVFRVIAAGEVVVSPSATSEEVTTPKEAETAATIVAEDEYLRVVDTTTPLYLCGQLGVAPLFLLFGLVSLKRRGRTRGVGSVGPMSLP